MATATKSTAAKIESFYFICGNDDFLVNREGDGIYKSLESKNPGISPEVIDGRANNVGEVEKIMGRVRDALQTLSLFGDKKLVWLKGVSFMGDNQTGKAQGTKEALGDLNELIAQMDSENVYFIITASPIDRRTKEFKSIQDKGHFTFIDSDKLSKNAEAIVYEECKRCGVKISAEGAKILAEKVNGNTRVIAQEIEKLATYLGDEGVAIDDKLVLEMVPQYGEGDFFEVAEAFFALDLNWTLEAIRRHFFNNTDARAIISSLQNRNRLMIQLRMLLDGKMISPTSRTIDAGLLSKIGQDFNFSTENPKAKSSFNVCTQNPWYLGRLLETAKKAPLKQFVDFQFAFMEAFEKILELPQEQESVMRNLAYKCLS